jgi:hypothetical protein
MTRSVRLAAVAVVLAARSASAFVLGGGVADKDCRLAFGGVDATAGASGVVCVDGAACDADATADGTCTFAVGLCVGVPLEGCAAVALDRVDVGGVALVPPGLPAAAGTCGSPATVPVTVGTALATTLRGHLGAELREVDYLNLCCVTTPEALDAAACAVAVDALASGCASLPARAVRKLERARLRVAEAIADPGVAAKRLRKAARLAAKLRAFGQKLARRDDCGFALGLLASHAKETLDAARAATGSAAESPPGR